MCVSSFLYRGHPADAEKKNKNFKVKIVNRKEKKNNKRRSKEKKKV